MIEIGQGLAFEQEAFQMVDRLGADQLQRHRLGELSVHPDGAIDFAHAATADQRRDLVAPTI